MSTVLHPAGPEPAQTYWVRRVAVIGAAIVVLAVAGALIANGTSSGSAVQAAPSPPAPTVVADSPTPTAEPSAARSGSSPSPTARPSAKASPSASAKAKASSTATVAPKPTKTPTPEPITCAADSLRPTLNGKQRLRPEQRSTFTLSLINGSASTCVASVNRDNFELRIYSGSDRIWSTKDCATIVKPLRRVLKAEEAMAWKIVWNGLRSRNGCKSRPEIPRPGTYYATAELTGAEPVRLLMTLRG